ncbi:MAG: carboxypeptidase-like regulatory domain-containing protein [Candidatus Sumerlaeota bacterium]|nr:carboxypeptidase-like regulatory domain-containing protein [Candidatus Sumerlaeota bacterium]
MKYSQRLFLFSCLAAVLLCWYAPASLFALIMTSTGSQPVQNMGWPAGSEKVANLPGRLGHWEGPPFGGGESHFEYRCKDTAEFNEALKVFAAIQAPGSMLGPANSKEGGQTKSDEGRRLTLVVNDGPKYSTFIRDKEDKVEKNNKENKKARMDWSFTVWIPASWHHLYNNPKSVWGSSQPNFRQPVPPPQIDVYIGGEGMIVWKDVVVPPNVRVIDKREESAPVKPVGGGMVCGTIYDMSTGQPVNGAEITVISSENSGGSEGVSRAKTNAQGLGEVSKIPAGWYYIQVRAEGYAARTQGNYSNKDNTYHEFATELLKQAGLKGVVADSNGKPLAGVNVTADSVLGIDGLGYACLDAATKSDEQGRFEFRSLPQGYTQIHCSSSSLHQATFLFELYKIPNDDIKIVMTGTGAVRGKVVSGDGTTLTGQINVSINPQGGNKVGSWGGSMNCKEDARFEFSGVPPGEYFLSADPMFHIEGKDPNAKRVTVKEGETVEAQVTKAAPRIPAKAKNDSPMDTLPGKPAKGAPPAGF